jgi:hypothetical protein
MDAGLRTVDEMEKVLADGLRELATELRLIDAVEFVTYIRMDKLAHIENLITSAAEVHFKPGTLGFGGTADLHLDWGAAPTVWLDMEFRNKGVEVYFSLILESCRAAVEINYMPFGSGSGGVEEEKRRRLRDALADARNVSQSLEPALASTSAAPLTDPSPQGRDRKSGGGKAGASRDR